MAGEKDAGKVKATVEVVYDDQGFDKAKQALSNVPEALSGLEQGAGDANDALAGLDEQMVKAGESAKVLGSGITGLEKPLLSGEMATSRLNDAFGTQISIMEETGNAFEALNKPVEGTTALLKEAAPQMQLIAEHAGSMQEQLDVANQGFAQIQESLSSSVPLLPQYASSLHDMGSSFEVVNEGSKNAAENMAVFDDALVNPEPFAMIGQHLKETGQTWSDFTSSIGDENTAILQDMATYGHTTYQVLDDVQAQAKATGQVFTESAGSAEEFTKQFNGLNEAVVETNKSVGETGAILEEAGKAAKGGLFGGGFLEGEVSFGGIFSGAMGLLNDIAMPLMAAQIIGQTIGAIGQSIYDAAAIAEGPGAHGFGTFTGAVDTLGASSQKTWQQFSEGFGQGVLPTLDAINAVTSQNSGGNFWGALGESLGILGGGIVDVGQILGGGLVGGLVKTVTLNPGNTAGQSWIQSGWEGLQNTWATITGAPEPFPGPPVPQGNPMQGQIDALNKAADNPELLASMARYQSAYGKAALAQANWDSSHYSGTYGPTDPMNQVLQAQAANAFGGPGSYGHYEDPNLAWLDNLGLPSYGTGCFVAGTRVRMADGSTRPIETLQPGEQVLAHDGEKQVSTTIHAFLQLPPKRVYKLTFEDGRTLTLTDSHPLAGEDGTWRAISPKAAKKENPALTTLPLKIGDVLCTTEGTCKLTSILPLQGTRPVFNIEVGTPHTFYANGILAHNKVLSSGGAMTSGGTGTEQIELSHTFTANVTWAANNLEKSFTGVANWVGQNLAKTFNGIANWVGSNLAKTFQGIASWVGSNLANTFNGVASWVGSNLANTFNGVASWVGQNLANTFNGVASWVGQNLTNTFNGVASWVGSNLANTFNGVASWVGSGLTKTFQGVASWIGQNLEHTFNAVANWTAQNLTPNFTVNPSFTMLAEGTSNWGGGPAIVGEAGPEVVESNGRYTLFDEGATLLNLPAGANVYPMKNLSSSSVTQFADGTGGSTLPLTLSGTGSEVTLHVMLMMPDGRVMAEQFIPHIAPIIRQQFQRRS